MPHALFRTMERIASRWTDYLVTVNREDLEAARALGGIERDRVRLIPGIGVDCRAVRARRRAGRGGRASPSRNSEAARDPASASFVTMVAEFGAVKRHSLAVDAFSQGPRRPRASRPRGRRAARGPRPRAGRASRPHGPRDLRGLPARHPRRSRGERRPAPDQRARRAEPLRARGHGERPPGHRDRHPRDRRRGRNRRRLDRREETTRARWRRRSTPRPPIPRLSHAGARPRASARARNSGWRASSPRMMVCMEKRSHTVYDLLKRVADVVVAAFSLVVLSPVFAVVALLVRVEPGLPRDLPAAAAGARWPHLHPLQVPHDARRGSGDRRSRRGRLGRGTPDALSAGGCAPPPSTSSPNWLTCSRAT